MKNLVALVLLTLISCKKPFSSVYEISDAQRVSLTNDTCILSGISTTNFDKVEEAVTLNYSLISRGSANSIISSNAIINQSRAITRVFINDTLSIFAGDSVFLNRQTKFVERILTSRKPFDLEFEKFEYRFIYKDSLLSSRLLYVNGDTIPYYESKYTFTNNQLDKVDMIYRPENKLIFQTLFTYQPRVVVKPWIYFYSDFFGLADHLLVFNFGAMPNKILTKMESSYYANDGIQKIGEWILDFSNYKISEDKYVLRVSSAGQRIQSLPFLFQNTELKYRCKS